MVLLAIPGVFAATLIVAVDLATIIYTSGTTGRPKGVMLTHGNIFHQFKAMHGQFQVGPGDRSLSFLPLSHVYERAWSYYIFLCGAENNYLANPKEVIGAMSAVRPTVMVSVPLSSLCRSTGTGSGRNET